MEIPEKLKSRKLWLAVIGAVIVVFNDQLELGLDQATIQGMLAIIATYILGEAYIDAKRIEK